MVKTEEGGRRLLSSVRFTLKAHPNAQRQRVTGQAEGQREAGTRGLVRGLNEAQVVVRVHALLTVCAGHCVGEKVLRMKILIF